MKYKVFVCIPAYNCENTIEEIIIRIKNLKLNLSILIVDDFSSDKTSEIASKFEDVLVHRNTKNLGYGGTSQKLYEIAATHKADYVINIHGDLGHIPEEITRLYNSILNNKFDVVFGSRLKYLKLQIKNNFFKFIFNKNNRGKMSLYRVIGHFTLTFFQNFIYGIKTSSYHEGMRACNKKTLKLILRKKMPLWYDYDEHFIVNVLSENLVIDEIPVKPVYNNISKSSAPPIKYGIRVILNTIRNAKTFKKNKINAKS